MELQLEQVEKTAVAPEVKDAVKDALRHMNSGRSRHRRGGQALVRWLEIARLRATEESEWDVVRLLQDSIDYASDRILKPEFEERYRLFQDSARDKHAAKYAGRILHIANIYWNETGREYLRGHPDTSPEELLDHIQSVGQDAEYLDAPEDRPGRYRLIRGQAERKVWIERVLRDSRIDIDDPGEVARRIVASPQAISMLTDDEEAEVLHRAAELKKRTASLVELRRIIEEPDALEADLQRTLEDKPWIFGGRYISIAKRRRLLPDAEFDIPLIRGDGSLHIVEIKRSMKIPLIKRHRNRWVLTAEVHTAIGQAVNYLVGLDENREEIQRTFGIDARRSSATVLIGHPAVHPDIPEEQVNEVLRTFNTHQNRVEVITYKELVDSAERSLTL